MTNKEERFVKKYRKKTREGRWKRWEQKEERLMRHARLMGQRINSSRDVTAVLRPINVQLSAPTKRRANARQNCSVSTERWHPAARPSTHEQRGAPLGLRGNPDLPFPRTVNALLHLPFAVTTAPAPCHPRTPKPSAIRKCSG